MSVDRPDGFKMAAPTPFQRHLPLALLLAWVAVDMLLPFGALLAHHDPFFIVHSPLALILVAQAGALAGWLILGTSHQLTCAVTLLLAFAVTIAMTSNRVPEDSYYLFCYLVVWCVPLAILRAAGWSFRLLPQSKQSRRLQTSVGELIALTTLFAVVLGAWKALSIPENRLHGPLFEFIGIIVLFVLLPVLWTLIGWVRPRHSLFLSGGIAIVSAKLASLASMPYDVLALRCALVSLVLFLAHVFALRFAGYKLVRGSMKPREG